MSEQDQGNKSDGNEDNKSNSGNESQDTGATESESGLIRKQQQSLLFSFRIRCNRLYLSADLTQTISLHYSKQILGTFGKIDLLWIIYVSIPFKADLLLDTSLQSCATELFTAEK